MDLMYMSDVMAYQTARNPLYSWDPPVNSNEKKAEVVQKSNKSKTPCKICQEKQRRSLMKYIRSKSHDHSQQKIKEEEEEEEQEERQVRKEQREETKR